MKRFMLFIALMLAMSIASAQTFRAPSKAKAVTDSTTTFKYEVKDTTYTVYVSSKGSFYIWRKSKKTGKPYRMYLPKEIQQQMTAARKEK